MDRSIIPEAESYGAFAAVSVMYIEPDVLPIVMD